MTNYEVIGSYQLNIKEHDNLCTCQNEPILTFFRYMINYELITFQKFNSLQIKDKTLIYTNSSFQHFAAKVINSITTYKLNILHSNDEIRIYQNFAM